MLGAVVVRSHSRMQGGGSRGGQSPSKAVRRSEIRCVCDWRASSSMCWKLSSKEIEANDADGVSGQWDDGARTCRHHHPATSHEQSQLDSHRFWLRFGICKGALDGTGVSTSTSANFQAIRIPSPDSLALPAVELLPWMP
ncbi:GD18274 [Drosophila simulans]|uniref:GD18274 n=1 Tax=Drosophila simulans TaxID=7240 RepID=B4QTR9_DROSI|nr:GD18274 [Drosophila simulans]